MKNSLIVLSLFLLVSCGKKTEYIESPGLNTLTEFTRGDFEECKGLLVQSGVDTNRNGLLDLEEVKKEQLLCNEVITETIQVETPVYIEVIVEKCKKKNKNNSKKD